MSLPIWNQSARILHKWCRKQHGAPLETMLSFETRLPFEEALFEEAIWNQGPSLSRNPRRPVLEILIPASPALL